MYHPPITGFVHWLHGHSHCTTGRSSPEGTWSGTIEREHVCEIPGPMQRKFDLQLHWARIVTLHVSVSLLLHLKSFMEAGECIFLSSHHFQAAREKDLVNFGWVILSSCAIWKCWLWLISRIAACIDVAFLQWTSHVTVPEQWSDWCVEITQCRCNDLAFLC